ncbi:MAG: tetratricopeptide repeat protein, partial [Pseudohongiella sp.]
MAIIAPAHGQSQSAAQSCPDLTPLLQQNPQVPADWAQIEQQLDPLLPRCLQNTEYFALRGAAQLNTGRLGQALESLERALLLNPDNGGAQVDYAQALYLQGQLFSAIDLNRQLLARDDLPAGLQSVLQDRQQSWRGMTRQTSLQADVLVGYDNNLNGGPEPGQITLTLSGEPVLLPLNPEFRPKSGPYMNLRLGGRYRQLAPEHQHNVLVELRGRVSEDQASDLLQLDTRYAFVKPGDQRSWQLNAGMSHLFFGGSPLYTATEAGGRYMPDARLGVCRPHTSAIAQHQLFHDQSRLNAVESK